MNRILKLSVLSLRLSSAQRKSKRRINLNLKSFHVRTIIVLWNFIAVDKDRHDSRYSRMNLYITGSSVLSRGFLDLDRWGFRSEDFLYFQIYKKYLESVKQIYFWRIRFHYKTSANCPMSCLSQSHRNGSVGHAAITEWPITRLC